MDIYEWKNKAEIALILGTGLNDVAREMMIIEEEIPFTSVAGLKASTAPGHKGSFLLGTVEGVRVIVMQGRLHFYEGYEMKDVVAPIKLLHALGVETLFVTNAAGGINMDYQAGDFMLISDHINFMGTNPLTGPVDDGYDRFPDMTFAYDQDYIARFKDIAARYGATVHTGVYIGVTGPSYETPAEIRAFRTLGADAVGMSTVPEVICAHRYGMRVVGLSLISNMAAGVLGVKLTEEEVLEAGRTMQPLFKEMISDFIAEIGGENHG